MTTDATPMTEAEAIALGLDKPVPASRALRPAPVRVVPVEVNQLEIDQPSTQPARLFSHVITNYLPWRGVAIQVVLNLDNLSAVGYRVNDDGSQGAQFQPLPDMVAAAVMAAGSDTIERARIQMGGRISGAIF